MQLHISQPGMHFSVLGQFIQGLSMIYDKIHLPFILHEICILSTKNQILDKIKVKTKKLIKDETWIPLFFYFYIF